MSSHNISRYLDLMAANHPNSTAVKIPLKRGLFAHKKLVYLTLSFSELKEEVSAWRGQMEKQGVRCGDRVLVMVRQGLPLLASVFALFQIGAVPIVIDPGMGRKAFLKCVKRSTPRVLLEIPVAHLLSRLFKSCFTSVEVRIHVKDSINARMQRRIPQEKKNAVVREQNDLAAILFTSGSTGSPKGACYTHGMFEAQVELLKKTYAICPGEIDLPLLAVFTLFDPALGTTAVIPELNPGKPSGFDPAKIVQAILQEKTSYSFGSPTLWKKIAEYCIPRQITLPSLRRVLCAGAPVPPSLWKMMKQLLPNGEVYSPYGATEALPVSSISMSEVLSETAEKTLKGAGTCVGRVIKGMEVKIIALNDGAIESLSDARLLKQGEIGEIIVTGPTVTHCYDKLPEATKLAKITDEEGKIWHRMGDCGYLDDFGRLWFCGRKSERVLNGAEVLFTEQVEPIFNAHPEVKRSALIGVICKRDGHHRAAIVIEPRHYKRMINNGDFRSRILEELCLSARKHEHTRFINLFYLHPNFPVDVRHNAKIHRGELAAWAGRNIGYKSNPL